MSNFLIPHFKKIPGIKKFHHFRMSQVTPGVVFVKEQADSPEKRFDLLKDSWSPSAHELPPIIPPHGLSAERQWYLYEQIRPFCPDDDKDLTCPMSSVQSLVEAQHLLPRTHNVMMMLLHHQNVSVPVAHAEEDTTAVHARISKTALKTS